MHFDLIFKPKKIIFDESTQTTNLLIKPNERVTHTNILVSYPKGISPKGKTRFKIPNIKKNEKIKKVLKFLPSENLSSGIEKKINIKITGRDSSGNPIREKQKIKLFLTKKEDTEKSKTEKPKIDLEIKEKIKGIKGRYQLFPVTLKNMGNGVAKNIMVKLNGPIVGDEEIRIDKLNPDEKKETKFSIKPYIRGEGEISLITYFKDNENKKNTIKKSIPIMVQGKEDRISDNVYSAKEINIQEDKSIKIDNHSKEITDESTQIQDSVVLNRKGSIGVSNVNEDEKDEKDKEEKSKKNVEYSKKKIEKEIYCPNCGCEIDPSWNFCPDCKKNIKKEVSNR